MVMPKPSVRFLVDPFIYREYSGGGDYSRPVHEDYVTIENRRIDRGSQYSFSPSDKQLLYNVVIFCYKALTTPLPDFKGQSLVTYGGKEHVITKIDTIAETYSDAIYSYESEMIWWV